MSSVRRSNDALLILGDCEINTSLYNNHANIGSNIHFLINKRGYIDMEREGGRERTSTRLTQTDNFIPGLQLVSAKQVPSAQNTIFITAHFEPLSSPYLFH